MSKKWDVDLLESVTPGSSGDPAGGENEADLDLDGYEEVEPEPDVAPDARDEQAGAQTQAQPDEAKDLEGALSQQQGDPEPEEDGEEGDNGNKKSQPGAISPLEQTVGGATGGNEEPVASDQIPASVEAEKVDPSGENQDDEVGGDNGKKEGQLVGETAQGETESGDEEPVASDQRAAPDTVEPKEENKVDEAKGVDDKKESQLVGETAPPEPTEHDDTDGKQEPVASKQIPASVEAEKVDPSEEKQDDQMGGDNGKKESQLVGETAPPEQIEGGETGGNEEPVASKQNPAPIQAGKVDPSGEKQEAERVDDKKESQLVGAISPPEPGEGTGQEDEKGKGPSGQPHESGASGSAHRQVGQPVDESKHPSGNVTRRRKNVEGSGRTNRGGPASDERGSDKNIDLKSCLSRLQTHESRDSKHARARPQILEWDTNTAPSDSIDNSFGCEGKVYGMNRVPISIESVYKRKPVSGQFVQAPAGDSTDSHYESGFEFVPVIVRGEHADHRLKLCDILIEIESREAATGVEVRSLGKAVGVSRLKREFAKLIELRQQNTKFEVTFLCQDDKEGVRYFVPEKLVQLDC